MDRPPKTTKDKKIPGSPQGSDHFGYFQDIDHSFDVIRKKREANTCTCAASAGVSVLVFNIPFIKK